MLAPELRDTRTATEQGFAPHAIAETLVGAIEGVLGGNGSSVSSVRVELVSLPEPTWEHAASLRLLCGVDDVQDFAVFACSRTAGAMVRWLFDDRGDGLVAGEQLSDGLAEVLNHVVGRVKSSEAKETGAQSKLETPEFLGRADAEMYAHVHTTAAIYRVTSDAWLGEIVFMASPKRQRAIAALEQATALLIRSGLEPGATIRACRLLEVVRSPVLALAELPSMGITLSWCVESLAALVNGVSGYGEKTMFYRILGELEGLQAALVKLTAPPETTAFVIPCDEDQRSLLQDFCVETLRGIERTQAVISDCVGDGPQSPFGLMHTVQVTAGFFHLDQLQRLARSTGRLIASVRQCGAKMTDRQLAAVRHSVDLIKAWVDALAAGLEGEGTVAWSAELEAHTRMLDHVLECGGHIVIHSPGAAISVGNVQAGQTLQLEPPQLKRLEELQVEVRRWAELARSEGEARSLAEPGEFFDRAHQELLSICQSVRRAPLGPVLSRLAQHCREASARHGKLVRVDATGEALHAPEHLLTTMAGPLVHLVNNAVEHGIEDGTERGRRGKKVLALVQLRAERIDGSIIFEVTDDGRGMPAEVLRELAEPSPSTIGCPDGCFGAAYRLRRRPEPTTQKAQGQLGIDVVVREVEAAGGLVELESDPGRGTRVRLILPESSESVPEVDDDDFADLQEEGELVFL